MMAGKGIEETHNITEATRLWVAQELERSDNSCFDELVSKWMLVYDSDVRKHRVLHVFHEIARNFSNGECAMLEESIPRTLALFPERLCICPCLQGFERCFFSGGRRNISSPSHILDSMPRTFQFFPYLRTLDLSHSNIEELPIAIGNLSHLRYLGLRSTRIQYLPESLCLLYKLQTLDLKDCPELQELPWGIEYLSDLQHLELPPLPHLLMPRGIGGLTRLRTLSTFVVGNSDAHCNISELKDLVNLRGELYVSGLNHVSCEKEAEEANLKSKEHVEKLTLNWTHEDEAETAMKVLEKLKPCTTLKSLAITGYYGTKLSSWLGDKSFTKLVSVTLEGCAHCTKLPPLGQLPVLKHLSVARMKSLQHVGREFCGGSHGFPLLETLKFRDMPLWEVWCEVGSEDFASLESVSFVECPKLNNLPEFLPTTLIKDCPTLISFPICEAV